VHQPLHSNRVNENTHSGPAGIFSRALGPRPFLEQHGFRVPDIDLDSSPDPSREGSIQVLESHPRTFSVPSIDLGSESEDEEEEDDDDNDDDDEDEDIEIASSIQDEAEHENTQSAATTPEQGALGKDREIQYVELEDEDNSPAKTGVRGLNLKGPRLEEILSKPTALGTSQLNPIDLEGTSSRHYDVNDTESEDGGPEILPIFQPVSKNDESTDWNEPQLARPQYRMPTVDDDATDIDAEDLVTRIILETQARNAKDKETERPESPEIPMDSVAGATGSSDSEDDDGFSQDDEFSDNFEHETSETTSPGSNSMSRVGSGPVPQAYACLFASEERKAPAPRKTIRATACSNLPLPQLFEPSISVSDAVDVSQPDHDELLRLSAVQRAPSPSDAALARKASDAKPTYARSLMDYRRNAIVPEPFKVPPPPERLYTPPFGIEGFQSFPHAEWQHDSRSRPYDQGPFSRRDEPAILQHSSATDKVFMADNDDDYEPFQPSNGFYDVRPSTLNTNNRSSSSHEPRKENEAQSSKINIASLVNSYHAENPRSSKRKADDISSSNDFEGSSLAGAPTQPAASQTQPSKQRPPPSPYATLPDENGSHLPDAQPRDHLQQAEATYLTQDSVVDPVTSSMSTTVITETAATEGPARKKARTSTSTSGGIGKFVSGVAVGLAGAFAAFVATIPASVREEALREMTNGA